MPVVEIAAIRDLECKVSKLDESMAKMAESLTQFFQKQAVHDERSVHLLEAIKTQRSEIKELRSMVLPLTSRVRANEVSIVAILKIAGLVVSSGAIGGALTKILGV